MGIIDSGSIKTSQLADLSYKRIDENKKHICSTVTFIEYDAMRIEHVSANAGH